MRVIRVIGATLVMLLCTTGCWNSKDIQNLAYVTAIGLDYENGHYIAYTQILNFSNVAKNENVNLGKPVPIWIGKGEGKTITESFSSIYATSQLRLFWGHVKVIICSERMLKRGISEAYDMMNRYREIRYNTLLYGTKEKLTDLLAQKSLFNMSPLETVAYTPEQIYSQRSFILPVYGYKVMEKLNEPSQPVLLPSLALNKETWREDKTKKPMFQVDGAFYFKNGAVSGWLSEDDLRGARWLQKKLQRSPINIPDNNKPSAALIMGQPKHRIKPVINNGKVQYNITLSMKGYVDEMGDDISEDKMEEEAAKVIQKEVRDTYNKGVAQKSDVLHLEDTLYRNHHKEWRTYVKDKPFALTEDTLGEIDVKVKVVHTGKYKGRAH